MKKKKLILILAVSAGVLFTAVSGSTYAYFTSSDSVTNSVRGTKDLDVEIWEDYNPPEEWLPGTQVDKQIQALNVGNVDAYVRMHLAAVLTINAKTVADVPADETLITDSTYSTLSDQMVTNSMQTEYTRGYAHISTIATDVHAIQADSEVICEHGTNLTDPAPAGISYTPTANGLYVFQRKKSDGTYDYAGYYYKDSKYYEIDLRVGSVYSGDTPQYSEFNYDYRLYGKEGDVKDYKMQLDMKAGDPLHNNQPYILASYEAPDGEHQFAIRIYLRNSFDLYWQEVSGVKPDAKVKTFFYKKVLHENAASEDLVTDLVLETDSLIDFTDFSFDLRVELDSVQTAYDENGVRTDRSAREQWGYTAEGADNALVWKKLS